MNKTSSLLLHLHLHLLYFLIMNKSSNLKKRKKKDFHIFLKNKKRERIFKKPWDQGYWARTSQVTIKKKKKIINKKFSNSFKNSRFLNFFKKNKEEEFSQTKKTKSLWINGIGLVLLRQLSKKKIIIKFFFRNRKL